MRTAYDQIQKSRVKDIDNSIRSVVRRFNGMYFQKIWDRRQTHAVYGVTEDTMELLKKYLKEIGAFKFRKVKANGHISWILCFSAEKISNHSLSK